jgi:hypothetical protein
MKDTDKHIIKELAEVKDLLAEILRRLGKLEYSGTVQYGDKYHVTSSEKQITVSLRRNKKESPNPYGDDDYATPK